LLERPEQLTERQAELWLEQRDRHSQERGRSMSAHEMLRASRQRVVLLGDPGTGKTTLMRYLAVMAAGAKGSEIGLSEGQERLPILVYMRDWAKHPERSLLDQVRDFAENTLQVELPPGFLEHWTEGQALLLLDGLDEVADDATRAALVEKINCFLAAHENNWAVITSRPWGYRRDYFRTDAYPHFELELFNKTQIQEFIEHWYENRCDNATQAQKMIRDLQNALKSKDRLQDLVKNPLLLTMVTLIHRYQCSLPKRRHKLYDCAVKTLLESWDRGKWGETSGKFKYLDQDDDLRRVMSQLAYWIHTQQETQTTESGTVVEEEECLTQLSRIIRNEYSQVKPHQAREEAERFVAFIRDRAGLLNEYGRGRYAFVHKTFQEYLTAEAILNEAECKENTEIIYEVIRTHLHSHHWREVLLLLVGQRKGKGAANAIKVILQQESPYEEWLHRDLLFAGRCLAEDPEKLATEDSQLVLVILQGLIELETKDEDWIGEIVKQETSEIWYWIKEGAVETEALKQLRSSSNKINKWRFLHIRAFLGEIRSVLAELLQLLQNPDSEVRYRAAFALGKLGNCSDAVVDSLLKLLENPNELERSSAAEALGRLGNCSDAVVDSLLKLLENPNELERSSAAVALGKLGNCSDAVVNKLLNLLEDPNSLVRSSAAKALKILGDHSEMVVNSLLQLLLSCNALTRSSAALVLVNLGDFSEETIKCLLELLKNQDSSVRALAGFALGELNNYTEMAINELHQLLQDPDALVRSSAALALVNLDHKSEIEFNTLIQLLQDSNAFTRSNVADALGSMGNSSAEVVNNLLQLLKDPESGVRYHAAEALAKLGKSDPKIQSTLFQWIEQHSDLPNLGSAIDALWQTCA
jgi:HEAT repeat protein